MYKPKNKLKSRIDTYTIYCCCDYKLLIIAFVQSGKTYKTKIEYVHFLALTGFTGCSRVSGCTDTVMFALTCDINACSPAGTGTRGVNT